MSHDKQRDIRSRLNRRHVLQTLGVAGIGGLAGCMGGDDDDGTDDDADDGSDDSDAGASTFEVSDLDVTEEAPWGAGVDVSATIENTGDADGSQDVVVSIGDEQVETETLDIDAGDSASLSLEDVDTAEIGAGDHTVSVETDDDDESASLTLVDRLGSDPKVLLFSVTGGWRHDNIETGNARIQEMSDEIIEDYPWETEAETVEFDVIDDPDGDASEFPDTVEALEEYDVTVWNNTTGELFDEDQQAAFREYIEQGGGYAGIHSASDTHYEWEWYGDLVGAYFEGHPPGTHDAEVYVEDHDHPSTAHLDDNWMRHDEWYDWQEIPTEDDVEILLEIDNTTYEGSIHEDEGSHPIGWYQDESDMRSWYTAGGHTHESWDEEEEFVEHARKGIMWAAGWYTMDDL